MIKALNNAASGIVAGQKNVDTIANNIANINTTGYKKSRADFKDAVYSALINPENPQSAVNLQQGSGVLISSISKLFSAGTFIETDNPLDFSLTDDGFFAVENDEGEVLYTRDGSFKISQYEGEQYLVNQQGYYVLDDNMLRITVYGDIDNMKADSEGYITFENESEPMFKIGVYDFANKSGLEAVGGNAFSETDASGQAFSVNAPIVKQKSLEGSNVDIADEMTNLIKAQRAYQIAARAISTADEMEALANNLRS